MDLELKRIPASSSAVEIYNIIQEDGGVILTDFITNEEVRQLNKDFDQPVIDTGPGSKKTDELESIKEFHGYQTTRVNNLTSHSKLFREVVLEKDIIHDLGELFFRKESGDWWLMATQLIQIGPGNKSQRLHRDLENFPAFIDMGPEGPCVTANFMIALTDFTEDNGATRLIPGSHKWKNFRMTPEDRLKHADTIPALMKAGDMLIWDGKLIHSGGENKTKNEYRRGIVLPITPAYFTPEESYAFSIKLDIIKTLSPRVQKLIGFRTVFPITGNGLWQHNFEKLEDYLGLEKQ